MPKTKDTAENPVRDDRLHVPTKAELLDVLQQDNARGGLQLEWMIDRCNKREGSQ